MAKLRNRLTIRLMGNSHFNDLDENKYLNKSDDFDEWCKLNRNRLIKLFADDFNISKEVQDETLYQKVIKLCESRFPHLNRRTDGPEHMGCADIISEIYSIAYQNNLLPVDMMFTLYDNRALLVKSNWFFKLYKSTDINYLKQVIEVIQAKTEEDDLFEQYFIVLKQVQNDLATIIAKVELEQSLSHKTDTQKHKTNKI